MKIILIWFGLLTADPDTALDEALAAYNVRNSWEDGFEIYASMLMKDTTGICTNVKDCVEAMGIYFEKIIQDDKTNTYFTLAWCALPDDNQPHPDDSDENIWWYDHWDQDKGDTVVIVIAVILITCFIHI